MHFDDHLVYTHTHTHYTLRADNLADAAGRPHQFEVRTARTRSNATTLADESKLTLIPKCYRCMPTDKCYRKQSECRAACLRCNPKRPA